MKIKRIVVGVCASFFAIVALATASAQSVSQVGESAIKAPTTLQIIDRKLGEGPTAANNEAVVVHYTGYFWSASAPDNKGQKFESSIEKRVPFGFIVGVGRVIKGWEEGVIGMAVGGQRTLIIPAEKAYGSEGSPNGIPPNMSLVFDIELMSIFGKTKNPQGLASPYVPLAKP